MGGTSGRVLFGADAFLFRLVYEGKPRFFLGGVAPFDTP